MDTKTFQVVYVPAMGNYIRYGDIFRDENGKIRFSLATHGHIEKWEKQIMRIVDESMRHDSIKKGDKCIMLKKDSKFYGVIKQCESNQNVLRELGWCKLLATSEPLSEKWGIPKILEVDIAYIIKDELTQVELQITKEKKQASNPYKKPPSNGDYNLDWEENLVLSDAGFVRLVRNIQIPESNNESNNRLLIATQDNGTVMFAVLDNNDFREAIKPALNEHYDCKVEIMSTSEPNNMNERTVEVNVFPDGEDPYTATVTLTPAYLYR